jgi:hypothetical protein
MADKANATDNFLGTRLVSLRVRSQAGGPAQEHQGDLGMCSDVHGIEK